MRWVFVLWFFVLFFACLMGQARQLALRSKRGQGTEVTPQVLILLDGVS